MASKKKQNNNDEAAAYKQAGDEAFEEGRVDSAEMFYDLAVDAQRKPKNSNPQPPRR